MSRGIDTSITFRLALGTGAILAAMLSVQCIRTYLYIDAGLAPQEARREAERQAISLTNAARSAGITDPRALAPLVEHAVDSASDLVLGMRVLDSDNNVFAQAGSQITTSTPVPEWKSRGPGQQPSGVLLDTPGGKAFVALLPFRMPRPPHAPDPNEHPAGRRREAPCMLQMAISLKAVSRTFNGLRNNLAVGLIASMALMLAVVVIGLRAPQYLRGKYLENEMQLAKRVQRDLQPQPNSGARDVVFAASAVAADHVGGDFYDVFEACPGKTAMVLGDVSGKGLSAALLVGLLQGAIRSSAPSEHEIACERINRMLCERTANTRFTTLFWGVFESATGTLRYVNAGHAAPMLIRHGQSRIERLDEGGPVLGLLPMSHYSAGSIRIEAADTLVLYSDGVTEAANGSEEEFGENRLAEIVSDAARTTPEELCRRVMNRVAAFANEGPAADDRTLMVVRFERSAAALLGRQSALTNVWAAA